MRVSYDMYEVKIWYFHLKKVFGKRKEITKNFLSSPLNPTSMYVNMHPNPKLPLPASIHSKSFCVLYFIPITTDCGSCKKG